MTKIEKLEAQVAELTKRLDTYKDNPQLIAVTKVRLAQAEGFLKTARARVKAPKDEVVPPPPPTEYVNQPVVAAYPTCHKCGSILEDVVTRCTQGGDCAESDLIAPIERPEPIEREEIKEPASNEG